MCTCLGLAVPAHANLVSFDFRGGDGSNQEQVSMEIDGVGVNVTGWDIDSLEQALVNQGTWGLGVTVTSVSDGSFLDTYGPDEALMFEFDTPVVLHAVRLTSFNPLNDDFALNVDGFDVVGTEYSPDLLDKVWYLNPPAMGSTFVFMVDDDPSGDHFRIAALTAESLTMTEVPEPTTFATLAGSAALLALWNRRRRRKGGKLTSQR